MPVQNQNEAEAQYIERRRREIAESNASRQAAEHSAEWQAQYEFWTQIISDEVARLRWNEGFEPIRCDLYKLNNPYGDKTKFVGIARVCGRDFQCTVYEGNDVLGIPILKLSICVSTPKNH